MADIVDKKENGKGFSSSFLTVFNKLTKGIIRENPIFILVLGLCPALAVSNTVANAIGMSAATFFVLLCSNMIISLLRNVIPEEIHIPAYIVIIASFVTIVELLMAAYFPDLSDSLGIYIPLIVVNCIILGRAEAFASKNTVLDSFLDAITMGIGFTFGLILIALVRESLGTGTITLFPSGDWDGKILVPLLNKYPIGVFTLSAGALFVMGYLQGIVQALKNVIDRRRGIK